MADEKKHIDDLLRDAFGNHTEMPPEYAWSDMEKRLDGAAGHIDGLFREALGGYAEMPPAGAWADMEARLNDKNRRRRGIIWFWLAAVSIGVLLGGYWFVNHEESGSARRGDAQPVIVDAVPVPGSPAPGQPSDRPSEERNKETVTPVNIPAQKVTVPTPLKVSAVHAPKVEKEAVPVAEKPVAQEDVPVAEQVVPAAGIPEPGKDVNNEPPIVKDSVKEDSAVAGDIGQKDDIAQAIGKRGTGVVMHIIKSPYADSVAEAEKKAQEQKEPETAATEEGTMPEVQPVIAENKAPDTMVVEKQVAPTPDTVNSIAQAAIKETEKALVVKRDASATPQIIVSDTNPVFEEPAIIAQSTAGTTGTSDKGSLADFIGPMEDTASYSSAGDATAWTEINEDAATTINKALVFDFFVKTGLERGLNRQTASKFVLAGAIQAKLSDKFSIILQPAVKIGSVNYSQVSNRKSYYRIRSSYVDSLIQFSMGHNAQGIIFDSLKAKYYYQQTHDSVIVSHELGSRKIMEAEVPVLANYSLGRGWSLYGGPVFNYSSTLQVKETVETYHGATRRDTFGFMLNLATDPVVHVPTINEVFTYNVDNFDTFNPVPYSNTTVNKIRLGYMLGVSWLYKDRISVDATVQQNLSRMNYIPNAGVRSVYTQPYFRFMLGYKLNGNKK